jgi:hypothetical protein
VSKGCEFHQDVIATWVEVDLCVDGSGHEMAAVAAHEVVFVALFL